MTPEEFYKAKAPAAAPPPEQPLGTADRDADAYSYSEYYDDYYEYYEEEVIVQGAPAAAQGLAPAPADAADGTSRRDSVAREYEQGGTLFI